MSRLVSKHPKKSVEIGMTLLKYINGNPGGIHVPTDVANGRWGARGQLKVQRHEKSLEVYADIAYAAGSQHRSLQGLVVMFAGVPVAWQCSQQPFVTHSTAEAELVSYCEALLAGRSSEALLCAMWGENMHQCQHLRANPLWGQCSSDWPCPWCHFIFLEDETPKDTLQHLEGSFGGGSEGVWWQVEAASPQRY